MTHNLFKTNVAFKQPNLPSAQQSKQYWGQLYGSADALAIAQAVSATQQSIVIICNSSAEAIRLHDSLAFFVNTDKTEILHFPGLETLPYDRFSPHPSVISQRLQTLHKLSSHSHMQQLLLCDIQTAMLTLPPRSYIQEQVLIFKSGDTLNIEQFRLQLENAGYYAVSEVRESGEFAVRGNLIDLYPSGSPLPYRIDLFDDEIDSVRSFNPSTQRTVAKLPELRILPAREFPLHEQGRKYFRQNYRTRFEGDPTTSPIYQDISANNIPPGIEYFMPLFFAETDCLFDYLDNDTLIIRHQSQQQEQHEKIELNWEEIVDRYQQRAHDIEYPILNPDELYLDPESLDEALHEFSLIELSQSKVDPLVLRSHGLDIIAGQTNNFLSQALPSLKIDTKKERPLSAFENFLAEQKQPCLIVASSAGRHEIIAEYLKEYKLGFEACNSWQDFVSLKPRIGLTVAELDAGIFLQDMTLITEAQLFGEKVKQTRKQRRSRDPATIIRDLTDLTPGSPVVHEQHGIGRYMGLETLDVGGLQSEFLLLTYAGGDKLYVPVHALDLISRYTGSSPEKAPLHKLGSDQWQRAKKKAAKKAHDTAAELLDIYSRRAARQGHAFELDEHDYRHFAEAFPYEETPDQARAIEEVLNDMRSPQPMDRVVCGDVGFGKTEVAMRAAFAAINGGKQAALLVPTTLLAQQHYENFRTRFADWPFKVEVVSRFRTAKEVREIAESLEKGKVDLLIGTHKLLSKDIKFSDLGLVIIDEEHRFGVRHKERLKDLRSEVDLLTLTATPIPRTLNMSLGGLRELSIIATPPAERVAVKTFISQYDENLIREACLREIRRGGQIYFLHNEVKTLKNIEEELQSLLPEVDIEIAHGQMGERALEQVMLDFYHRRFQILLCTTIIESGIDNPSANTILINRADRFGLAQLHQIRGRVGRSNHRAYAYMLIPHRSSLTEDAKKRIDAIEAMDELGSGFVLATHDLEIRGAGELLGKEQSGQMQAIGFTLFMEMLERAVKALKEGKIANLEEPLRSGPEVNLHIPALLPDAFMPDVHLRLILYKRISSVADDMDLQDIHAELIDRFGPLPDEVKHLLDITRLKLKAKELGIEKIDMGDTAGTIVFSGDTNVEPIKLIQLIQKEPLSYKLLDSSKLRFYAAPETNEERFTYLHTLLKKIS